MFVKPKKSTASQEKYLRVWVLPESIVDVVSTETADEAALIINLERRLIRKY
jgi:hypothetical protein